ncbi:hypothetical protein ASE41_25480 [Streptomyces sp. Root264]|nr:hypothetical protein ASE41_25480 [Streptomyces sp. Root264]
MPRTVKAVRGFRFSRPGNRTAVALERVGLPGTAFHAWCGGYNTSGNFWVYGRVGSGQVKGWIFSENPSLSSGSVNIR